MNNNNDGYFLHSSPDRWGEISRWRVALRGNNSTPARKINLHTPAEARGGNNIYPRFPNRSNQTGQKVILRNKVEKHQSHRDLLLWEQLNSVLKDCSSHGCIQWLLPPNRFFYLQTFSPEVGYSALDNLSSPKRLYDSCPLFDLGLDAHTHGLWTVLEPKPNCYGFGWSSLKPFQNNLAPMVNYNMEEYYKEDYIKKTHQIILNCSVIWGVRVMEDCRLKWLYTQWPMDKTPLSNGLIRAWWRRHIHLKKKKTTGALLPREVLVHLFGLWNSTVVTWCYLSSLWNLSY